MATTRDPFGVSDAPAYLRSAAELMRERAQAASPGPWGCLEHAFDFGTHWDVAAPCHDRPGYAMYLTPPRDDPKAPADSMHIASWHPGVALIVADLLDACARAEPALIQAALAVACAFTNQKAATEPPEDGAA